MGGALWVERILHTQQIIWYVIISNHFSMINKITKGCDIMKRDITDAIRFSDEESRDFSSILNNTINELCVYADSHDFNRNKFIIHVAEQLSLFGKLAIADSFEVNDGR